MKAKKKHKGRWWKILLFLLVLLIFAVGAFATWFYFDTPITPPEVKDKSALNKQRETVGENYYRIGNNWLRKNKYGLWEMYLEGSPFEMGVVSGKLTKELIRNQEIAFVDQIKQMIPSESYLKFLRYFIAWFNRDIDEYIIPEYQEEIYGVSFSCSNEFEFIAPNYERMLNYHGAHDIGHALQQLALVGCTSFAANMGTSDSSLILGRNFDFYISEAFAKDKIVVFVNPEQGHKFTYVTWASFIGVVSGMNDKGLTVTINAGASEIPFKAATPISLLAREILQYAGNIEGAITIAKKRDIFVSESLLIGSASDNKAVIIEKSPSNFGVYETDADFLVCANHFQSDAFAMDKDNLNQITSSPSAYRQRRSEELITAYDSLDYMEAAEILRDRNGLGGESIGIGNEKAMAQVISHHSVIFQPLKKNMWVSTAPYQFGPYLGYNLPLVFEHPNPQPYQGVYDTALTIPADPFADSEELKNYLSYKEQRKQIIKATQNKKPLQLNYLKDFIGLNPDYFQPYVLAGDYYVAIDSTDRALRFYKFALTRELENTGQREEILGKIKELE